MHTPRKLTFFSVEYACGQLGFRVKKQTGDVERKVEVIQERTGQIDSELKKMKSKVAEIEGVLEDIRTIPDDIDPMRMAMPYYQGEGVPQDDSRAMKWCDLLLTPIPRTVRV